MPARAALTTAIRAAKEPPGDEDEHLRGGIVQPVPVVDDAEERLLFGDLREQGERGEPNQEAVGRGAGAQPEDGRERITLRHRQSFEVIQHRGTELVQPAVDELHLGLDADRGRDAPTGSSPRDVVQQRALARACVAAKDESPTPTGKRVGQDPVKFLALGTTSEEHHRRLLLRTASLIARPLRPPSRPGRPAVRPGSPTGAMQRSSREDRE